MKLKVVTLVDKLNSRIEPLRQSCERFDLELEVLGDEQTWLRNSFKFRYLYKYLHENDHSDEDVLLVVDAFDVIIDANEKDLLNAYRNSGSDILFSAEANYYFREPELTLEYWKRYPRKHGSIYHFLNSGTFIGTIRTIKELLAEISKAYKVDFFNDEQLDAIRSDQYLYSRFYVDCKNGKVVPKFSLDLDHDQQFFGCSGGRMCVTNWPIISEIQDYLFFKYERRMLKTFRLEKLQIQCRDLKWQNSEKLQNKLTGSFPLILHLPGTHKQFRKAFELMKSGHKMSSVNPSYYAAWMISAIAYFRSCVNYHYIKLRNKNRGTIRDIFPVAINRENQVTISSVDPGTFPTDNPFTINE
ncbi:MAG: hypothetical protein JXR10_08055 [Cyclobacteriaceae bacterium]